MTSRQKNLALITLIVAVVLEVVDLTIVNTALPAIAADFGAKAEAVQWIVAGYALAFALLLMAGGRLGDTYGYRPVFLWGVTGFTLASMACGLARTSEELVAARLLQGAAGAVMSPQAMALMQVLFEPLERVSKLALFGLVGGLASIAGPIIGGILIDADIMGLGWRLVFLINLPVGILALVSGWYFLPDRRSTRPSGADIPGMVLFGMAVLGLLWPLTRTQAGWGWRELASLACAAPLFFLGWGHVARRVSTQRPALFDPSLLAIAPFRIGLAISVAFAAANAGFLLTFAFGLQAERGQTPLTTGLLHMPFGLGAMVGIAVLGRNFLPKYGKWVLVAGGSVMAIGAGGVIAGIGPLALSWTMLAPLLLLTGMGMGALSGCIAPISVAQVDRDHAGAASGLLKTAQQLGAALGIAVAGSVYFAWDGMLGFPASSGAFLAIGLLLALCIAFATALPERIFAERIEPAPQG